MQIAILHQDFEYFACFTFKKTIVRQNYCSTCARLESVHYVLDEVELFVAGFDCEVVAVRSLVCSFCAEWRIREDHIVALAAIRFVNGIAKIYVRFDAMKIKIHESKAARPGHEFLPVIGGCADSTCLGAIEYPLARIHEPLV